MRVLLIAGLLMFAVLAIACDPGIGIDVFNKSDVDLRVFIQAEAKFDTTELHGRLIQAGEDSGAGVICLSDQTAWLLLLAEGREIYARSATCGEWEDSGAWVTVEGANGEFTVTDSLAD